LCTIPRLSKAGILPQSGGAVQALDLEQVSPRSIVYLYSGGKDSSLALLLTRDRVKAYTAKTRAKVYIVHIVIPGNSHPLNTYCSSTVMVWHKKHYGFEPVWLTSPKVFQEYIPRYGLQTGPQRWCYTEFKWKPIIGFLRRLPRPILTIDGMSPHDSKVRAQKITSEFTQAKDSSGFTWWSWHPLYNVRLSRSEKLKVLKEHKEFKCVVELYEKYGDSLNCVVCPYRTQATLGESQWIIAEYLEETIRSRSVLSRLTRTLKSQPLTTWMNNSHPPQ